MATTVKETIGENKKFLLLSLGLLAMSLLIVVSLGTGFLTPNVNLPSQEVPTTYNKPEEVLEEDVDYTIVVNTIYGDIYTDLYEDIAPVNVNSFLFLISQRYYEGLSFHKVIKGFVAQAGDTKGDGSSNPGYNVKKENLVDFNDYDVGMANASQFFVVLPGSDKSSFNGEYPLVGRVTQGYAVLESMEKVEVDRNYRPINEILINSIQIHEN